MHGNTGTRLVRSGWPKNAPPFKLFSSRRGIGRSRKTSRSTEFRASKPSRRLSASSAAAWMPGCPELADKASALSNPVRGRQAHKARPALIDLRGMFRHRQSPFRAASASSIAPNLRRRKRIGPSSPRHKSGQPAGGYARSDRNLAWGRGRCAAARSWRDPRKRSRPRMA